jgi:hypothetical protein
MWSVLQDQPLGWIHKKLQPYLQYRCVPSFVVFPLFLVSLVRFPFLCALETLFFTKPLNLSDLPHKIN